MLTEAYANMIEPTAESIFGVKAGIVWQVLNKNGTSNIGDLVKKYIPEPRGS